MDHDAQNLIDACADAQANGESLPAAVDAATSILVDAGATSIQRLMAPADPDTDRQNAMRDRDGEVLARVERVRKWADRWLEHYHSIRPDLDAILAQVERDQAELARLRKAGGDLLFWLKNLMADVESDCPKFLQNYSGHGSVEVAILYGEDVFSPTTSVPQQAEPKLRASVASESAIERARAAWLRISWGTQNTMPQWQVNEITAVFATAITEAEQAARAAGRAEAAQVVRNRACRWMAIARDKHVTAEYVTDDFSLVEQQIRELATKPSQPQEPKDE